MVATSVAAVHRADGERMTKKIGFWDKVKRCYEHMLLDRDDVYRLLGEESLRALSGRVTASEMRHSGEVCMCVEASLPLRAVWSGTTSRERAEEVFALKHVWDTEQNNGVLIYFLLADHAIEIVTDRGLTHKVSVTVWKDTVANLQQAFKLGAYEAGLTRALEDVSAVLVEHFPLRADEVTTNELDDYVVVM